MNEPDLQRTLTALRAELDQLPASAPGRPRMLELLARIEAGLDPQQSASPTEESLLDGIHQAATEFEVEHPQASALLQRVVQTLSNMGI